MYIADPELRDPAAQRQLPALWRVEGHPADGGAETGIGQGEVFEGLAHEDAGGVDRLADLGLLIRDQDLEARTAEQPRAL